MRGSRVNGICGVSRSALPAARRRGDAGRSHPGGTAARLLGVFGLALSCLAGPAVASETGETARDYTRNIVKTDRTNPQPGAHRATLTARISLRFETSSFMQEPIVRCGATVLGLRGHLRFELDGQEQSIFVDNHERPGDLEVHQLEMIAIYDEPGGGVLAIRCDAGLVGTERQEAMNLAWSPTWDRFVCRMGRSSDYTLGHADMPDRLGEAWCPGDRFLSEAEAMAFMRAKPDVAWIDVAAIHLGSRMKILERLRREASRTLAFVLETQLDLVLQRSRRHRAGMTGRDQQILDSFTGYIEETVAESTAMAAGPDRIAHLRSAMASLMAFSPASAEVARIHAVVRDDLASFQSRGFMIEREQAAMAALESVTASLDDERASLSRIRQRIDAALASAPAFVREAPPAVAFRDSRGDCPERTREWPRNPDPHLSSRPGRPSWLVDTEDGRCLAGPLYQPEAFSRGLARVYQYEHSNAQMGYKQAWFINPKGERVLGEYSDASSFHPSGYAWIRSLGGQFAIIDTAGRVIVPRGGVYMNDGLLRPYGLPRLARARVDRNARGEVIFRFERYRQTEAEFRTCTVLVFNEAGEQLETEVYPADGDRRCTRR